MVALLQLFEEMRLLKVWMKGVSKKKRKKMMMMRSREGSVSQGHLLECGRPKKVNIEAKIYRNG